MAPSRTKTTLAQQQGKMTVYRGVSRIQEKNKCLRFVPGLVWIPLTYAYQWIPHAGSIGFSRRNPGETQDCPRVVWVWKSRYTS